MTHQYDSSRIGGGRSALPISVLSGSEASYAASYLYHWVLTFGKFR